MLHKQLWFVLCAIGFLPLFAQAQTLAVVGNKSITVKDFQERYNDVKRQTVNPPEPDVFLEELVRFEIGLQEAEKAKIKDDPIVQRQIQEVIYRNMIEKAIGKQVEKIEVTESDMKAFYKDNPEIRTSHILIEYKVGASATEIAEAKKRAEAIYAEVKSSKRPFEELVKLYTDDTVSKETGGDIGWQSRVTLVPPYYEAALKLKVGEVHGLVQTRYGFHIIKLTGKHSYQEANKRQLRAATFDEKRRQIFNRYFENLKKKYKIQVNKKLVDTLK